MILIKVKYNNGSWFLVLKQKIKTNSTNYEDLTNKLKNMKVNSKPRLRRLSYAMDKDGNKYYDYYFENDKKIIEELFYQKKLEELTGYKVYLNPKTHTNDIRTPDFWIKDTNELWDLKGIDGSAKNIIDNIFKRSSSQTYNLILKKRNTPYDITFLKEKIKYIYDKNYRKKIKKIILFDEDNNLILYYKR